MSERDPLLQLRLSVDYANKPRVLSDVRLEVGRGEVLGLIGQSGSGKSTISLAILGLLRLKGGRAAGSIRFDGREVLGAGEREMRRLRGREISLVLQSPIASLNPTMRIGAQMREAWRAHESGPRSAAAGRTREVFDSVNLPSDEQFLRRYPHQLSVGQAQRVLIAMAVLHRPKLLIADEPTSALDSITHAEILALFDRLAAETGTTVLFISHDLLSVASLCDRVAILHDGQIVETGPTERIFFEPSHPYTKRLVEALPRIPDRQHSSGTSVPVPHRS